MTREIKFRAWARRGIWQLEADGEEKQRFIMLGADVLAFEEFAPLSELLSDKKDDFYLMQYTGLKDKDDKEIYEGDILRQTESVFCMPVVFQSVVEYQPGGFWFRGIDFNITDCNWHQFNAQNREVIGNIYENPELLNP